MSVYSSQHRFFFHDSGLSFFAESVVTSQTMSWMAASRTNDMLAHIVAAGYYELGTWVPEDATPQGSLLCRRNLFSHYTGNNIPA
jgi:hypothetical protein